MNVHRNRFIVNKTNRCTEIQFYWYYDPTCFGQPFCPSSGVLSRTSALVHFMQLWWQFATRSGMELQFHPAPGSKRSSQLHKMYQSRCTAKNSWWWAERLFETCRIVIPIKLEFSASVGLNYKKNSLKNTGDTHLYDYRSSGTWRRYHSGNHTDVIYVRYADLTVAKIKTVDVLDATWCSLVPTFRRDMILPSSRVEGGKLYVIMEKRVQCSTSFPVHPSTTW